LIYLPAHRLVGEPAYVLPRSVDVIDTTALVHRVIARLQAGDEVRVMAQTGRWSEVSVAEGQTGWVETKYLLDAATYHRGETLLESLERFPAQASGHNEGVVNLRLDPARDSVVLMELGPNTKVEVFGRKIVERPVELPAAGAPSSGRSDVWYLVRTGRRAGWMLGRFIDLDIPAGISPYAEDVNMVAWLILKTVDDGGKQMPEYLAADRIGNDNVDYNHIRVFTWWVKEHKYVTAYVESNVPGHFPITTQQTIDSNFSAQRIPYFRLRLTGEGGRKFQKVYGLFDTVVRPVGTVEGWDSDAMPAPVKAREQTGRRRARRGRR
jgi:Bacterial SH3 domain